MFWDRFLGLCNSNNETPNAVCKKLKLSNATATHWKSGTIPNGEALSRLSDYFHCSTDYLLGKTDDPTPATKKEPDLVAQLSLEENEFVTLLRQASEEKRAAILALLK